MVLRAGLPRLLLVLGVLWFGLWTYRVVSPRVRHDVSYTRDDGKQISDFDYRILRSQVQFGDAQAKVEIARYHQDPNSRWVMLPPLSSGDYVDIFLIGIAAPTALATTIIWILRGFVPSQLRAPPRRRTDLRASRDAPEEIPEDDQT